MVSKLEERRVRLDEVASKEEMLFTPQQYEATFERKLFSNTLGLDIRLTQGNNVNCLLFIDT